MYDKKDVIKAMQVLVRNFAIDFNDLKTIWCNHCNEAILVSEDELIVELQQGENTGLFYDRQSDEVYKLSDGYYMLLNVSEEPVIWEYKKDECVYIHSECCRSNLSAIYVKAGRVVSGGLEDIFTEDND